MGDEAGLLASAERQHLVFTRAQALRHGFSDAAIAHRLRIGRWVRLHPGVYGVAGAPESLERRVTAACLAAGPDAVASHGAAGGLWALELPGDAPVEVTVPFRSAPEVQGVAVHRTRRLLPTERTHLRGIPVTSPSRTLVDLAGRYGVEPLEDAVDELVRRGVLEIDVFLRYLDQPHVRARAGTRKLRAICHDRRTGVPESAAEARLLRTLREGRLPLPERQLEIRTGAGRFRVDFAYPEQRVALEVDGYAFHSGRRRWQADRARQNALEALGWRVLRFSWADVTRRPATIWWTVAETLNLVPRGWVERRREPSHRRL